MIRNAIFVCCDGEVEDIIHALWECQVTKEIWWEVELCQSNIFNRFTCFRDLLTGIFQFQEPNLAEVFTYVAWSIWTKRNALRLGNRSIPYSKFFADANERLQEYQANLDPTRWSPPPIPFSKRILIFQDISFAGIGVVIRESTGKVVGALSERIKLPPTVEDVESLACKRVIAFAIEIGLHRVVFEGDLTTFLNYLQANSPCQASFGIVIEDSLSLASQLDSFSFSHAR